MTVAVVRRNSASKTTPTDDDARHLRAAICALGDYDHIQVRAQRGHVNVYSADDPSALARLTPQGAGQYALSFHRHTGRWEPMPFMGNLPQMAEALVTTLAPYLERWDFSDRNSESDH